MLNFNSVNVSDDYKVSVMDDQCNLTEINNNQYLGYKLYAWFSPDDNDNNILEKDKIRFKGGIQELEKWLPKNAGRAAVVPRIGITPPPDSTCRRPGPRRAR